MPQERPELASGEPFGSLPRRERWPMFLLLIAYLSVFGLLIWLVARGQGH